MLEWRRVGRLVGAMIGEALFLLGVLALAALAVALWVDAVIWLCQAGLVGSGRR